MYYILDENNKPVKSNIEEFLKWRKENPKKRVVKQEKINNTEVSTIFLGLDHSFMSKIPVLWETMIFGGEHDNYQERYESYEDALIGHQKALDLIK